VSLTGWITLAGSGSHSWRDGVGSLSSFLFPTGVCVNASGFILVADWGNHRIRAVSPSGQVTTLAGNGRQAWVDGTGSQASFNHPLGVAVLASGLIAVADADNHCIRTVSPTGQVTTLAGSGYRSWADGMGSQASFNQPQGMVMLPSGVLVVADFYNNRLRTVSPSGLVATLTGNDNPGWNDGFGTQASFYGPAGVAVMPSGVVMVVDMQNGRLRTVSPSGLVRTLAGNDNQGLSDGLGTQASFHSPTGVTVMPSGVTVIADTLNNRLRSVAPSGLVQSIAGNDNSTSWSDGVGTLATFSLPVGVAASGDILSVADKDNSCIRQSVPYNATFGCPAGFSGRAPVCTQCSRGFVCPAGVNTASFFFFFFFFFFSFPSPRPCGFMLIYHLSSVCHSIITVKWACMHARFCTISQIRRSVRCHVPRGFFVGCPR
jgi:hypothetical protein